MVELDSNPAELIEIVEIGRQLLIARGAFATLSVANDVAKCFAMLPAMFAGVFPGLEKFNVLRLCGPQSAITSAIVFNALVIVVLVAPALRGVRCTSSSVSALLRRNLWIYGVGGLVIAFAGIKLLDVVIWYLSGMGR